MRLFLLLCTIMGCFADTNAQYHFYFGNIHAHTAYSDGSKDNSTATPASSYQYAKGAYHMDFLGISEHNHYSASHNPGMHVADYAKGLYQADTSNQNGHFVCLFGMEYGVINNGGHVIVYGIPGLIGWESGSGGWGASNNYNIYNSKYDYKSLWKTINSFPNAFATLAHPQNDDYDYLLEGTYNSYGDSAVVGCAIRSGDAFSTTNDYSDNAAILYQSKYFLALAKGYHLGPTIDHDNHYTTFGRTTHTRTVVLSQELNRDSIMAAYKVMRFYASDDWDAEVTLLINNHVMGESDTTSGLTQISVSINDPGNNTGGIDGTSKIEVFYGIPGSGILPTILTANAGSNNLNYTHTTNTGDSFYYFAKISQTDGNVIWTSPIWMKTVVTPSTSVATAPTFFNTPTFEVYPNPSFGIININLEMDAINSPNLKIYNMQGREIYSEVLDMKPGKNSRSLDIQDLPAGIYILVVSEANHRIAETRFIKQ